MLLISIVYYVIAALFLVGLFGLIISRDVIKLVLAIGILELSVNMFLVATAYNPAGVIPIITKTGASLYIDPLPHAMVLTSIVIGFGVMGLSLGAAILYVQKTGSTMLGTAIEKEAIDE